MRSVLAAVGLVAGLAAQESVLEVPATGAPSVASMARNGFVQDGNRAFFIARDAAGNEVWVTDGTVAGTHRVFDLVTGPGDGARRAIAMLGGRLLFEGGTQDEYWLTDGTLAGTTRLPPIPSIQVVAGMAGGRLIYTVGASAPVVALDPSGALEAIGSVSGGLTQVLTAGNRTFLGNAPDLHETDGTAAGTHLVLTGSKNHAVAHDRIWFTRQLNFFTCQLLVFDPSTNTTSGPLFSMFVSPIHPFTIAPVPNGIVAMIDIGGRQLWTSDGTPAGTRAMNLPGLAVNTLLSWHDRALVLADDGVHALEPWVTDGTEGGTYLFADLVAGPSDTWRFVTTPQGTVFRARDPNGTTQLILSDGTAAGTRTLSHHARDILQMLLLGPNLVVREGTFGVDPECIPWTTTVTSSSATRLLPDYPVGGTITARAPAVAAGGQLLFFRDGAPFADSTQRTMGTRATTTSLGGACALNYVNPPFHSAAAVVDDTVLLPMRSAPNAPLQIQRLDTVTGTMTPFVLPSRANFEFLTAITAQDDRATLADDQLLLTDGTPAGTTIRDFPTRQPQADEVAMAGGTLFERDFLDVLRAQDPALGTWTTLAPQARKLLATFGDRLFYADNNNYAVQATAGGAPESLGITLTVPPFVPPVFPWNGSLWLFDGHILWSTNGTAATTHAHQPPPGVQLLGAAPLGSAIFLVARDAAHGRELWQFDGTTFSRTTDLVPGFRDSVFSVAACGDRLFLAASDGTDGIEPYVSDGTAAGTHRIADLMPGLASSLPAFVATAGDFAYFTAQTPGFGNLMAVPLGQLGVAHSERIGQGCAGRNGIPQLATPMPPRLGDSTFRFELTRGASFAPAFFALDTQTMLQQLGPCRLRCGGGLGVVLRATNAAGTSQWTIPLPNAPQLLGLHLTAQAAVLDSLAAGPGYALSTTLGCVVGAP